VTVGPGVLDQAGVHLPALPGAERAFVVSDADVAERYLPRLERGLAGRGLGCVHLGVPVGEEAKSLPTMTALHRQLAVQEAHRDDVVVALGGGAVGDLAGFVAATYMRGMNFVQVPTTLLAQVDASIGGKTAIDHPRAKNLIGAFHQPRLVLVDPAVLTTLPDREFRSGLAEVIKHGIVLDAGYFRDLEQSIPALLARDLPTLERVVGGSCRLKAQVVERDEQEAELRWVLNYGHTIGHALEAATAFTRWAHGEAVALGISAESRLAERLGLAAPATRDRQVALLRAVGLPVAGLGAEPGAVVEALSRDKKARDGRIPFVLSPEIGRFQLVFDVPAGDILATLNQLATGA
jgi:3-dehydroquinate synthase